MEQDVRGEQAEAKAAADILLRNISITKTARYRARKRLATRHRESAFTISALSTYVIALSLLPNILDLAGYQNQIILAATILLSVFVVFASLLDGAQNFHHKSELLLQCARQIASIEDRLRPVARMAESPLAGPEIESLRAEYRRALAECPVSHDDCDFYLVVAEHPQWFEWLSRSRHRRLWRVWYWLWGKTLSSGWMVPHLLVFLIVSLVVYHWVLPAPFR